MCVVKKIFIISFVILLSLFSFTVNAAEKTYSDTIEIDFYRRASNIYIDLADNGSVLKPALIGSVYYVSQQYANDIDYAFFTDDIIYQLFQMMDTSSQISIIEQPGEEIEEEIESTSTETTDNEKTTFTKYNLTTAQLKGIARVCQREQGSVKGAAAEASLIANRYELYGSKYSSIYTYVRNSGWWGSKSKNDKTMSSGSLSSKIENAVRDVLVDGKRTLPKYVDEHDCIYCGSYGYDITKIVTDGKKITSHSELRKHSNYISNKTKIYNKYGATYTFYTFPTESSDPFGYTKESNRKKYGDFHYDIDGSTTGTTGSEFNGSDYFSISANETLTYDEDAFRSNLRKYWFETSLFSGMSDVKKDKMTNEVFEHYEQYLLLIGYEETEAGEGVCSYNVGNNTYVNPGVQLLYCDGSGTINTEDIVDFEKYITGVVYAENGNGPYEALKVQAVATRSYSMTRPSVMGGSFGVKFSNVDGRDVVNLRSCTLDQVYCDPDEGCWSNRVGGQTGDSSTYKESTVYSKEDKSKTWHRGSLSDKSDIRKAVLETTGEVAVDANDNIVNTSYINTTQQSWNKMAKEGKDYYEILKKHYDTVTNISSTCSASSAMGAEAETWRQGDPRWGDNYIGSKNLRQVGCMITSTAIQIARSGTKLNVSDFNPGIFLQTIKAHNGVSGNDFNVDDNSWSSVAPNFKVGGVIEFSGSDSSKIEKMKQYVSGNKYLIIRLYHPGQHWVAVTGIENGKIKMADPASDATDFASKYSVSTVSKGYYFVKND